MLSKKILFTGLALCISASAFAHFQLIHTTSSNITDKNTVPFELIFTHPGEGMEGHSMDIGKDEKGTINPVVEFFSIHNGEKTDLKGNLKASKFGPASKQVTSYKFNLDKALD